MSDFSAANSLGLTPEDVLAAGFLRVELDWQAYYDAFKAEHGDPVAHGGRLLFADGWTYSATDPAGPEWPPPKDERELLALQLAYWETRRRLVVTERDHLRGIVRTLREMQSGKSIQLVQRVAVRDELTGKPVLRSVPARAEDIEGGRLMLLELDARDCESRLLELRREEGRLAGAIK